MLLALPALRELGRASGAIAIDLAGNREFTPVLTLAGSVSKTLDFGSALFAGLFADDGPPDAELAKALSRYHEAVLWMRDPEAAVRRRLTQCGMKGVRGGDPRAPAFGRLHMARRLALLAGLPEPDLMMPSLGGTRPRPTAVVLHPGSGGLAKMWPLDSFARAGKGLLERGLSICISSGPADGDRGAELAELLGNEVEHVRPAGVLELAELVRGARSFLGNDSGPTHLAAALGVPTVAVFGPTDPAIWSPCGPNVTVLGGHGAWPPAELVLESLLTTPGTQTPDSTSL